MSALDQQALMHRQPGRQVYILEKIDGRWALTVPKGSRIERLCCLAPTRWCLFYIEGARIGDSIEYTRIYRP